ncbi:MAG TPA: hypothetical protein VLE96_06135 [Chlamydiales bacterium]|nr:hypothetical protein [Chlamydiales bacterium]
MKTFLILLLCCSLHAAPVGNPSSPRILCRGFMIPTECWVNIRGGYEGDFVFDGNMEQAEKGSGLVDKYTRSTHSGTATLDILERLDLYGVFGYSKVNANWRFTDLADRIRYVQLTAARNFLWSIGGRAILYSYDQLDIGLGARYGASHHHLSTFTIDGDSVSLQGGKCEWRGWQANLGLSYHICILTPYIGALYMDELTVIKGLASSFADFGAHSDHLRNRCPVGMYLGCTLSNGQFFMVNVESRLISEEALSVTVDFRF